MLISPTLASDLTDGLAAIEAGKTGRALELLNTAYAGGEAEAGFYLGRMVETGTGLQADFQKAFVLYRAASDKGSAKAMNRLGVLAVEGKLIAQNYAEARNLFCLAAGKGEADAQYNCATLMLEGRGGDVNAAAGHDLLAKAASAGHIGANTTLGLIYAKGTTVNGTAVKPDLRKAQGYLEQAASRGNPIALLEIATFYETGRPLARDLVRAHLYYALAAANGHPHGDVAAHRLATRLTPQQMQASKRMALSWRARTD